jgi:hypothetical protein
VSLLSEKALSLAQQEFYRGVRGGVTPYGRFRGARVDEYLKSVGLMPNPRELGAQGWPWCASFVYFCFRNAAASLMDPTRPGTTPNTCPRTASALHLWQNAPAFQTQSPSPGDVFVLGRGEGKGHTGIVESLSTGEAGELLLTSIEGDTSNALEDATGDAVGRHVAWDPEKRPGFTLVGYLTF